MPKFDDAWKQEPLVQMSEHEIIQLVFYNDRVYIGERYSRGGDHLTKKFSTPVKYVDGVKKASPVSESKEYKIPLGNNMLEAITTLEFFTSELKKKYKAQYGELPVPDSAA